MEAKYRLVTTWPEDSVQVRDRTSNEILVEMKPHELVTMKNTFDQAREALKELIGDLDDYWNSQNDDCSPVSSATIARARQTLAAMEATHE